MPQQDDHIRQARHNAQFLSTFDLNATPYPDWAITVAFYTAVHLVEAHFARNNIHYTDHKRRNREVSRSLRQIGRNYITLYNQSRTARYNCQHVTPADAEQVLINDYEPVRAHLSALLRINI
jgi:hypothetical protein